MGLVPKDSTLSASQRKAWTKGDRSERYREQAGRFQEMAEMEVQQRTRERLLELAGQYLELADRVDSQKTGTPTRPSVAARGRNG